jgi:hypothetical protein
MDRIEQSMNSMRRTSFEILLVKQTTATERKMQQSVEEMKREQEIAKMTRERAAKENQIMGETGTIRAEFASERGEYKMVWR